MKSLAIGLATILTLSGIGGIYSNSIGGSSSVLSDKVLPTEVSISDFQDFSTEVTTDNFDYDSLVSTLNNRYPMEESGKLQVETLFYSTELLESFEVPDMIEIVPDIAIDTVNSMEGKGYCVFIPPQTEVFFATTEESIRFIHYPSTELSPVQFGLARSFDDTIVNHLTQEVQYQDNLSFARGLSGYLSDSEKELDQKMMMSLYNPSDSGVWQEFVVGILTEEEIAEDKALQINDN